MSFFGGILKGLGSVGKFVGKTALNVAGTVLGGSSGGSAAPNIQYIVAPPQQLPTSQNTGVTGTSLLDKVNNFLSGVQLPSLNVNANVQPGGNNWLKTALIIGGVVVGIMFLGKMLRRKPG